MREQKCDKIRQLVGIPKPFSTIDIQGELKITCVVTIDLV